jgi:xylan 1,4-beta-xylosidase
MLRSVIYVTLIATIVCVDFSIDLASQTKPFPHYWEQCVGSGHAALALRADYQRQLKLAHDELGFKYVRFHGLLHDDMSTVRRPLDFGKWKYSFFNIDSIFDYFLSIGMKPLIELSFMPQALASAQHTVFHWQGNITPPKNDTEWSLLIKTLVQHLVDRYGIEEVAQWPIEVSFFKLFNTCRYGTNPI